MGFHSGFLSYNCIQISVRQRSYQFSILIQQQYIQVCAFENNSHMKQQQLNLEDNQESIQPSSPPKEEGTEANQPEGKKKGKKKKMYAGLVANLIDTQYPVVKKVVNGMLGLKVIREAGTEDWDLYWTDNAVTNEQLSKMKLFQKINHFPGMFTLSRKNYLARNLIKMEKKFPNDYNFFPKTWVLPSELNEFRNFMESDSNAVVIAKPEASSQGRGIFLTKSFEDFEYGEHYVVQKYLKKPFLIDGLKFDLRVYVLVAGCDPLRVYIYKEGLARFATEPYCTPKKQNLNNLFMHLTNYAINKNSEKFEFNNSATQMNKGHKRSLTAILTKLQQLGHSKQKVWEKIKDCIAKTLISAQPLLAHHYRSSQPNNYANNMCFEILGFDVILDHNLKPEVLEVNYTPSFTTDTPLDLQIKKSLIHDALVLMNLTTKAKNEIINEKKKEMKERTLTGKNFSHTREARQATSQRAQKMRNLWEGKHLGNYERIMPVVVQIPQKLQVKLEKTKTPDLQQNEQDRMQEESIKPQTVSSLEIKKQISQQSPASLQTQRKYNQFLQYSKQCYQNHTGANIRRNTKVIPQNNSIGQFAVLNEEANAANVQTIGSNSGKNVPSNSNQTVKYTNSENLQKIYKSKFRPMIYKRNNQGAANKKSKELQQKHIRTPNLSKIQSQQTGPKVKTLNPYLSTFTGSNPMHQKHKSANPSSNVGGERKVHSINRIGKEEEQKGNHRTAFSFKKGLSTVYNITFHDKKNQFRPS